jgi:hypothetical protein
LIRSPGGKIGELFGTMSNPKNLPNFLDIRPVPHFPAPKTRINQLGGADELFQ